MRDWIKTSEQLPAIPEHMFAIVVIGAYWDTHYAQHLIQSGKDVTRAWDVGDAMFSREEGWTEAVLRSNGSGWYRAPMDEPPLYWQYYPDPPALISE